MRKNGLSRLRAQFRLGTISKKKDILCDHLHLTLSYKESTGSSSQIHQHTQQIIFSVSLSICLNLLFLSVKSFLNVATGTKLPILIE